MIKYLQAHTEHQLRQILALQQENLPKNLSADDMEQQGFLTVEHSYSILKEMNDECGHIIAESDGAVVAYALCMHPKFAESIPVLKPMFKEINKMVKQEEKYMVMGQICVAKNYRGKGLFRGLYTAMKQSLPYGFDSIITEVDAKNKRSLAAHKAVGFVEERRYTEDGKEWVLITLK